MLVRTDGFPRKWHKQKKIKNLLINMMLKLDYANFAHSKAFAVLQQLTSFWIFKYFKSISALALVKFLYCKYKKSESKWAKFKIPESYHYLYLG